MRDGETANLFPTKLHPMERLTQPFIVEIEVADQTFPTIPAGTYPGEVLYVYPDIRPPHVLAGIRVDDGREREVVLSVAAVTPVEVDHVPDHLQSVFDSAATDEGASERDGELEPDANPKPNETTGDTSAETAPEAAGQPEESRD